MVFEIGQKVRRIGKTLAYDHMYAGNVYTINKILVSGGRVCCLLEECSGQWHIDKFIPFEWQAGDAFKIVKEGLGIDEKQIGKYGHLLKKRELYVTGVFWDTDIPMMLFPQETYFVGEFQIEFIQPNGNTSVDVNPCIAVTAFAAAPMHYLNKAV